MTKQSRDLVELGYRGGTYWAEDLRYWVMDRYDRFVYGSYDDLEDAQKNVGNPEMCAVWDREENRWA